MDEKVYEVELLRTWDVQKIDFNNPVVKILLVIGFNKTSGQTLPTEETSKLQQEFTNINMYDFINNNYEILTEMKPPLDLLVEVLSSREIFTPLDKELSNMYWAYLREKKNTTGLDIIEETFFHIIATRLRKYTNRRMQNKETV